MRRITPRTCLWPIAVTLVSTFALSIGLTYRSDHHCYAGVCGEWLFPLQARLHVVVWYMWISGSVVCLGVRAFSPELRRILHHHLHKRNIPFLGKRLAVSGVLVLSWIITLYGIVVGIWWVRLRDYFDERGKAGGVLKGNRQLAAIALTGHICDITMGMVLLPISRHSALASFFKLSVSTTLAFHMITAYALFIFVVVHGFLYVSWIPVSNALVGTLRQVYPVLNPTYLKDEVWPGSRAPLGIWRASLAFTGLFTTVIMLLIFITTLPHIRRHHFNTFYFTHLVAIAAIIVICLHASTMFYCLAPGLVLWLIDWGMRVYELKQDVEGDITTLGKGYYLLEMKMPRRRLDGCACTSPLAHFYIYHSKSSIRELHPFTTITHLASEDSKTPKSIDDLRIQFLFKKKVRAKGHPTSSLVTKSSPMDTLRVIASPKSRKDVEWTEKIASDLDVEADSTTSTTSTPWQLFASESGGRQFTKDVSLRLEGPYFTPADPSRYHTVVCLVAGTGISGAVAIAHAYKETQRRRDRHPPCDPGEKTCSISMANSIWKRCVISWSVREDESIDMPFLKDTTASALEVHTHLTGPGKPRIDFAATLADILTASPRNSVWVYLSGPNPFIIAGEKACQDKNVDWYGARWEI